MEKETLEIRWHGRGGQGAKTAAAFLAEAVMVAGRHSQGFPEYGPERRGAPVRGYTRISDNPIRRHCGAWAWLKWTAAIRFSRCGRLPE